MATTEETTTLVRELLRRGVYVYVREGQLRARASRGGLSERDRSLITERKPNLLELLRSHPCAGCGRFAFHAPMARCFWCRARSDASQPTPTSGDT